jgi:hypothetical protein
MKLFRTLLSVVLFCSYLYCATCSGQLFDWLAFGETSIENTNGLAIGNSNFLGYAIAFVIAIIVLSYMVGRSINDQKLLTWAKIEGANFAISIALIFVVLGAFIGSCELSTKIAGIGPNENPIEYATLGLKKISDNFGISVAKELLQSSVKDQFNSMFYAYWSDPIHEGGGLAYRANVRAFSAHKELLIDLYLPLAMMIEMQRFFLELVLPGVVGVILPSALLFRLIFATRDVGNILVAISFSIYFVFPLMYILTLGAVQGTTEMMGGSEQNPFENFSLAKSSIVGDAFLKIGFVSVIAILIPNIVLIATVTMTMALYKGLRGIGV